MRRFIPVLILLFWVLLPVGATADVPDAGTVTVPVVPEPAVVPVEAPDAGAASAPEAPDAAVPVTTDVPIVAAPDTGALSETAPDAGIVLVEIPVSTDGLPIREFGAPVSEPLVTALSDVPVAVVPTTDEEAAATAGKFVEAAKKGAWPVALGFALLFIVFVCNKNGLAAKVGRQYVPWVTVATGGVAMVGVALAEGSDVTTALQFGLTEGGVAIALYELGVKRFMKTKTDGSLRKPAPLPAVPVPIVEIPDKPPVV